MLCVRRAYVEIRVGTPFLSHPGVVFSISRAVLCMQKGDHRNDFTAIACAKVDPVASDGGADTSMDAVGPLRHLRVRLWQAPE